MVRVLRPPPGFFAETPHEAAAPQAPDTPETPVPLSALTKEHLLTHLLYYAVDDADNEKLLEALAEYKNKGGSIDDLSETYGEAGAKLGGVNALHIATQMGAAKNIEALLKADADPDVLDASGNSARDYAKAKGTRIKAAFAAKKIARAEEPHSFESRLKSEEPKDQPLTPAGR